MGPKGNPAADARRQEEERQARIKAATDEINNIFGNKVRDAAGNIVDGDPANNRDVLAEDLRNTVFSLNSSEVERQAQEAARAARFGLARTGLAGGSVQVDNNAELNRRTNEGLLRAGGIADQSAADLRAADERSRSNLISLAQSGIDTGTAASQALQSLRVNADSVANQRSGATIGRLFDDLGQAFINRQINAGRVAGQQQGQQVFNVSSPRTGSSGSVIN